MGRQARTRSSTSWSGVPNQAAADTPTTCIGPTQREPGATLCDCSIVEATGNDVGGFQCFADNGVYGLGGGASEGEGERDCPVCAGTSGALPCGGGQFYNPNNGQCYDLCSDCSNATCDDVSASNCQFTN